MEFITEQYIEQLNIDKNNLVNNLIELGIQADTNETFTSLVPKIIKLKDIISNYESQIATLNETINSQNAEINAAKLDLEELVTLEEEV